MILLNAHEISKSFTDRPLFKGLSFSIHQNERIGLIGPNGAGKSTLLKILSQQIEIDNGRLSFQKGIRVGFLEQTPRFTEGATALSSVLEASNNPHDWEEISKALQVISKVGDKNTLVPETEVSQLSGGWKKRVALARELFKEPDLLLLDEPTNHLDIESILWLEEFINKSPIAVVTITHDRAFLQNISNRIIELNRRYPNGLLSVNSNYLDFLESRDQILAAQEVHETKLKNTLRRETEWLRRGAKARQTKQQARIQQAQTLKENVSELQYLNQNRKIDLQFQSQEKNPKKLIEAKEISKSYNGVTVIPKIDLLITPKSRIGLIGRNGCGKSTLLKLLLGTEKSDTGSLFHSEKLDISYFEQNKETLNPKISVLKTICPDGDFVSYGGKMIFAKSYLARFLFSYEQMGMPVEKLSGGEQSRLLLAQLMLKKANVLILDEPTNDLDISTLDVLQEILEEFEGAIILVSHDRYFLDNICKQLLAFGINDQGQKVIETFADLSQWEPWYEEQVLLEAKLNEKSSTKNSSKNVVPTEPVKTRKLSFKEQHELDSMEEKILGLETELQTLTEESQNPNFANNKDRLLEVTQRMGELQGKIQKLYDRWAELTK